MEQMKENAQDVQVIEIELSGELKTFDVEAIRDLWSTKDFWYNKWCEVSRENEAILARIETLKPYLENVNVNVYQVLTNNKK